MNASSLNCYGEGMAAKRALVTGCSTGIGRATAVELTARGYDVVTTARRVETLDDLKVAQTLALDVDSDASIAAALAETGPVDVLVNNAGFGVEGAIETAPLDEVRRMFETNFFGAARMIQACVPTMRERGSGAVVNVTSIAGVATPPLGGYYSASKFALEALSEALHLELGHFGVRVIVIEPGVIETNFGANVLDHRLEPGPYAGARTTLASGARQARRGRRAARPEPGCVCHRRRARLGKPAAPLAGGERRRDDRGGAPGIELGRFHRRDAAGARLRLVAPAAISPVGVVPDGPRCCA